MPEFSVSRSIEINASADEVFGVVADFGTWTKWSPWLCAEPTAKVVVSENSNSVGSLYSWEGEIVGQGEIEHEALDRGKHIQEEIRFQKPFKSTSSVSFDFEATNAGTRISWNMLGSLPWFLFWMKSMMETTIGMDYERGLKMLKEWIETGTVLSETNIRGVESIGPIHMFGARKVCSVDDIGPSMESAFKEASDRAAEHSLPTDGERISVYHCVDLKAQTFDFTAGFSLSSPPPNESSLATWSLPASQALAVEHIGSYENLGNAWGAAYQYARYKKLKQSKTGTFEIYKNCPDDTAPGELRTEIFLPLR